MSNFKYLSTCNDTVLLNFSINVSLVQYAKNLCIQLFYGLELHHFNVTFITLKLDNKLSSHSESVTNNLWLVMVHGFNQELTKFFVLFICYNQKFVNFCVFETLFHNLEGAIDAIDVVSIINTLLKERCDHLI